MRKGYYYTHSATTDTYIEVLKGFQIKQDEWLVKCRIYNRLNNTYYEQTEFRLNRSKLAFWSLYTPRGLS